MPEEIRELVTDDDDLDKKRAKDDYKIQLVIKWAMLILSIVVAVVITAVVLIAICSQQAWRDYAIRAVFDGLPGIAAVVAVVLGIKKLQH